MGCEIVQCVLHWLRIGSSLKYGSNRMAMATVKRNAGKCYVLGTECSRFTYYEQWEKINKKSASAFQTNKLPDK